ncbi:hypothetical protein ACFFX0_22110 [Citricoccus parietis]|uniref:Uncharacterized protein n=1 Tax=Citricoccus parietis TaxID=592307 RepID=A0ABV5G4B5_9MICC
MNACPGRRAPMTPCSGPTPFRCAMADGDTHDGHHPPRTPLRADQTAHLRGAAGSHRPLGTDGRPAQRALCAGLCGHRGGIGTARAGSRAGVRCH